MFVKPPSSTGMTIIEIMVVLAIVASLMAMGMVAFSSNAADLRNDANHLATIIRYTYSNAALTNTRYRLVFDIDKGTYYTEIEDAGLVVNDSVSDDEFLTEEAQKLGEIKDKEKDLFDEDENPFGLNRKISFKRVEDVLIKNAKLSSGVRFSEIKTTYRNEPYYDGLAAMSFFPGGFQDQILIFLKNEDGDQIALQTEPMTGRVVIYTDLTQLPDDFGAVEYDE